MRIYIKPLVIYDMINYLISYIVCNIWYDKLPDKLQLYQKYIHMKYHNWTERISQTYKISNYFI
jgi:hypothetical protein